MAYRLDDTALFLFGEGTNAYAYRALDAISSAERNARRPVRRLGAHRKAIA